MKDGVDRRGFLKFSMTAGALVVMGQGLNGKGWHNPSPQAR